MLIGNRAGLRTDVLPLHAVGVWSRVNKFAAKDPLQMTHLGCIMLAMLALFRCVSLGPR